MSPLLLLAILGVGALVLSAGKSSPKPGASPGGAPPGSLAGVATKDDHDVWTFTPEAAVGLWRALLSHAYTVDPAVAGRVIVAPEISGAALPKGKAATDWALEENALASPVPGKGSGGGATGGSGGKGQYILAPIYMAFDSKGTRYLRAAPDASIATAKTADKAIYAVLAAPGAAAALDAEANAEKTPIKAVGVAGGATGLGGASVPGTAPPPSMVAHALTLDDVVYGPGSFATRAGFDSVDAMLKANPDLQKIDPLPGAGWPPIGVAFDFAPTMLGGDLGSKHTYLSTLHLDAASKLPTFTVQDPDASTPTGARYTFPSWSGARAPAASDELYSSTYTSLPPALSSAETGKIYGDSPLAHPEVTNYHAVVPWAPGQVVQIPADHPLLSL